MTRLDHLMILTLKALASAGFFLIAIEIVALLTNGGTPNG